MISAKSEFKLLLRGFKDTLLLLPGWATDYRIFNLLDLEYNYLLPYRYSPFNLENELPVVLDKYHLEKISVLGWSLGGFVACALGNKYPERIKEITLVGIRKRYEKDSLAKTKTLLTENKKAILYQFYRDCFSRNESEAFLWFKNNLWLYYLLELELSSLFEGLDYLSTAEINPLAFNKLSINIIHGEKDKVASIQEALEIKNNLAAANYFCIKDAGHIAFLNPGFKSIWSNNIASQRANNK
ncbi:MAG: alpha/beta hydrolase [Elusimicrobia bacterium]|nr:alpha/beta hydrolase [Elusimicrobiota bacterium]